MLQFLQYNFEGRYDLVRFIKTVQKAGLYAHLRVGPYVCAEWNFGLDLNLCLISLFLSYVCMYLCMHACMYVCVYVLKIITICRGFPVWLKFMPGISFRTDNEPFKVIPFCCVLHCIIIYIHTHTFSFVINAWQN